MPNRDCVIPNCPRKVKDNRFFMCPQCYHEYCPNGVIPKWASELRRIAWQQERSDRRFRQHEVPAGLLVRHEEETDDGGFNGDWTDVAEYVARHGRRGIAWGTEDGKG